MASMEIIVWISVVLVIATSLFLFKNQVINMLDKTAKDVNSLNVEENTTNKSTAKEDNTTKDNSTDKNTQSTTQKQETPKQETKDTTKQETKETQAPTVVNNITNNNQNQYKTVIINEAQVPTQQGNSFLENLESNILAELIVAVLFAGLTWFIRDYLKLRKKQKLNMNKD